MVSTLVSPASSASAYGRQFRPGSGYVVVIGDSRSAFNGDGSPLRQPEAWFQQLCARSRQRIRHGGVYATAGFTLSQIRDTHLPSVLAMSPRPSACFVFGGTNVEASGLLKDGLAVLHQIVTRLRDVGITPILVSELPRSDTTDPLMQQWNVAQRRYADRMGLIIFDANLAMLTQTGSTTDGQRNLALTVDNVHPNLAGHTAISQRGITDGLHLHFPPSRATSKADSTSSPAGDYFNLLTQGRGLFRLNAGSGLASGWSAAGTNVTYSLVTPALSDDLVGNWQRVVRTAGGATSTVFQVLSISAGFAPGDTIAYTGRFRSTVAAAASTFTFQVTWNGVSSHSLEPLYSWVNDYTDGAFYGEATIPAGTTSLNVQVALSVPTTGTSTLDVGELTVWNMTSANALLPT